MTEEHAFVFYADAVVELADRCGLLEPDAMAAMLRALADVLDCRDPADYGRRKEALVAASNSLNLLLLARAGTVESLRGRA